MFRFHIPGLSDSMNCALTWLILQGGQYPTPRRLAVEATASMGRSRAVRVTDVTVAALERRGLITVGRPGNGHAVQLADKAIRRLCQHTTNPHPVPVMEAACLDHWARLRADA